MDKRNSKAPVGILRIIKSCVVFIYEKVSHYFDRVIFHRTGSVLVSLFTAIAICVGINYDDISLHIFKDSTTTIQVNNVAVETLIDTDKYTVSDMPDTVSVSLTGNSADIQLFRQQGGMKVVADLRKYEPGETIIDLKVNNLPSSLNATINPEEVTVHISKLTTKQFTINGELMVSSNQKTSDFEVPELSVDTVKITGSSEQINAIRSVKAIVDASGQTSDFETEASIVAYDANGTPLDVHLNPNTVHATVKLKQKENNE